MLRDMNSTFLSVIPKCDGDDRLGMFRLIALCNVVYKILSKLLVERLKHWIGKLVSREQGGFVADRKILDGVVIVAETIHSMAASKEKDKFIKL